MGELRGAGGVIVLLEPTRPTGFVSGGYRYQDEVMRCLDAGGSAQHLAIAPAELESTCERLRAADTAIVVDGLFAARASRPLPAGVIALLHMAPESERWCRTALPIIATSEVTAAKVRDTARAVAVVRPGLDACFVPPDRPPANPRLRIVVVGTICRAKNQLLTVRTLATVGDGRCELVLIGDTRSQPDYVDSVQRAAGSLPLSLTGCLAADAVAEELQRADLFVSASMSESFGMAAAEAAACGTPVLAFDTGELRTLITGSLVATADEFVRQLSAIVANSQPPARHANRPPLLDWPSVAAEFARAVGSMPT